MRTTIGRIALLLVALALVAAACGGDDSPFGATTTTAAAGSDTTGADTTSGAADTTEGSVTTGPAPAGGDIDELLARAENAPMRTTYRFGEAPNDQIITLVQDPTLDPPASAMILPEGKFISRGDQSIICDMTGPGQCIAVPGGQGAEMFQGFLSPVLTSLLATGDVTGAPGYSVEEDRTQIAGRQGICFTFTPQAFVGSDVEWIRQCIDSELGFTLLFEGRNAGDDAPERIMELLEFGRPQPDDFEPTGPVTEMPGS